MNLNNKQEWQLRNGCSYVNIYTHDRVSTIDSNICAVIMTSVSMHCHQLEAKLKVKIISHLGLKGDTYFIAWLYSR